MATSSVGNPSKLTVKFELLDRQETTRIESWSIDSAFLTSTDAFTFTLLPDNTDPTFRDLELQPVELLLDGSSQVLGRIEKTMIGHQGIAVECQGRDFLSDLVESNVDPTFIIKESMTLGQAILNLTAPCGILAVLGDDEVAMQNVRTGFSIRRKKRRNRKKTQLQELKPRPTEGMFEYGNRLCARHGVLMHASLDRGTLLLNAPDYDQEPAYGIHVTADRRAGTQNNVIEAQAIRDYTRFPTYTLANGKQARSDEKPTPVRRTYDMVKVADAFSPEMKRILSNTRIAAGRQMPGVFRNGEHSLYRLLHIEDFDARNDDQLDHAALRAIAERLKDTLEYSVTLRGHVDPTTNAIWSVNTMVHVVDEVRGIDERLWIAECNKRFAPSAGATTELKCWRPDSFAIEGTT